jgi:hypothetical protein
MAARSGLNSLWEPTCAVGCGALNSCILLVPGPVVPTIAGALTHAAHATAEAPLAGVESLPQGNDSDTQHGGAALARKALYHHKNAIGVPSHR